MELVEPEVLDGLLVVGGLGLGEAVEHGRGDDVLDPLDVHVVQVLARPDVAVRGVAGQLAHLLVELVGDDEPHGGLFLGPARGAGPTADRVTRNIEHD